MAMQLKPIVYYTSKTGSEVLTVSCKLMLAATAIMVIVARQHHQLHCLNGDN